MRPIGLRTSAVAATVTCVIAVGGCGGKGAPPTATSPGQEKTAVLKVIADSYDAYTRAEGDRLCELMAPALRDSLVRFIEAVVPSLEGKPCGKVLQGFYRRIGPKHTPQAIDQASAVAELTGKPRVPAPPPRSRTARLGPFQKAGSRWLITAFPMLPKGFGPGRQRPPALVSATSS